MGFLKRLFSMGGKRQSKSKSKTSTQVEISNPMPPNKRASKFNTAPAIPYSSSTPALLKVDEDPEVAVHRLLRSSSARWAVAHEVDHSDLPPMPHPINDVLSAYNTQPMQPNPTGYSTLHPTLSTASLASASLSRGGSYSVKVYRKQRLSSGPEEVLSNEAAEKRKNRTSTHLNANDSRTLKLRSEPSIVSLVSLYDDQGRLPDEAFNDVNNDSQPTPRRKKVPMPVQEEKEEVVKQGRAQCKRSGSTLRQLLGASTNGKPEDASEGDISWAERFLGEVDGVETDAPTSSTRSSFALPTPNSEQGHGLADVSIVSNNTTIDNPAISSMDVELSISTTASRIFDDDMSFSGAEKSSKDSTLCDPTKTPTNRTLNLSTGHTPQKRASQVFGFIKKRASKVGEKNGPALPGPPKALRSSSSDTHAPRRSASSLSRDEREINSQATPRFSSEKTSGIPVYARDVATPSRPSGSSQRCDEREDDSHLTPRFSLERASGIPVYSGDVATPSRPKPSRTLSDRIDSGGLENMGRMMMRGLSFNRGSAESNDEEGKGDHEPEAKTVPDLCVAAQTPMRPTAETDAEKKEREVRILMTGPTKVIVTAPTPGTARDSEQTGYNLTKIPRGPRTPNTRRRRTSGSDREERRRYRQERENSKRERADKESYRRLDTILVSTPQKKVSARKSSHRSSSSVSSIASNENAHPNYGAVYAEAKRFVESSDRHLAYANKFGNGGGLGVKSDMPSTPLRTSKRTILNRDTFQPPAAGHEDAREERRKPRGERHLYALPGLKSAGNAARHSRV